MTSLNGIYRLLIAVAILIPYKMYTTGNKVPTPFMVDFLVAALAFGLGYLIFPVKTQTPPGKKHDDDRIIDGDK